MISYQFECFQEGCQFLVRAESEDEIVHLVEEHARYAHDLDVDSAAIRAEIERR